MPSAATGRFALAYRGFSSRQQNRREQAFRATKWEVRMIEERTPAAKPESCDMIMENLGIVRTTVDIYHYREYRYSKFEDAVAQAKRDLALK